MRAIFPPLAGVLLAVLGAVPVRAGADLKAMDDLLGQARPLVARFEEMVKPDESRPPAAGSEARASPELERLRERCLADFSRERMLGARIDFPIDDDLSDSLRRYHECEAFSRKDVGFCRGLNRYSTSKQKDLADRCRINYNRYVVTQLNITGRPDAAKVCESLSFSADDLYGTSLREECAWQTGEPDPNCKDLLAPSLGYTEVKDCLIHPIYHGDGRVCPLIKKARITCAQCVLNYETMCLEASAYRRAYEAKDASLCGDSLGCRMLMGEKVCGGRLEEVGARFCRLRARKEFLEALLARLGGLIEGFHPESEPGYAARRDEYRSLRGRSDRFLMKTGERSGR
jgi:hypothetical protein